MSKNKALLIGILACLIAVYIVIRSRGPNEKEYPIFDLDSLAIGQIEIFDQADTLKFQKQKGVWMLVEPVTWEADKPIMQQLFREVLTAKYPKTPMGTGKRAIERFNLKDEQALHLRVSDTKGRHSTHVLFSNMGNAFDYFRYQGSNQIYQIKAKVTTTFTTQIPMWRNPDVISFSPDSVQKLEITHTKNSYTLTRVKNEWFYKDSRQEFLIPTNNRSLFKLLNVLAGLKTYVFVDDANPEQLAKFKNPVCTVQIYLVDGKTHNLKFVMIATDQYLMMVDNDPSVLFSVVPDSVFRFMRSAEVFKDEWI